MFSFGLAFLISMREFTKDKNNLFKYLFTSVFVFMLFKQSFVRADLHVLGFFRSISVGIGFLYIFMPTSINRYLSLGVVLSVIYFLFPLSGELFFLQHIADKYNKFGSYLTAVFDPNLYNESSQGGCADGLYLGAG